MHHEREHKNGPAEMGEPASDPTARDRVLENFAQWLRGTPTGGEHEPPPTGASRAAQELIAVLRRRVPRASNGTGRRYRRHPWRAQLSLLVQEPATGWQPPRSLVVSTCDLSRGGFGFLTADYIPPGTIILARFENLPGHPCVQTCVRHCSALAARLHRVGVEFREILSGNFGPHG